MTPEAIAKWTRFATDSPLYVHLAGVIAGDAELMRVLDDIVNPPPINILFGAVHMLLAREPGDPLAAYYPDLTSEARPIDDDLGGEFRRFVLEHEGAIAAIGASRYTQTNEVRRAVALLPAVWMTGLDRFHLVEIGASAGLHLALDRYRYRWGAVEWGDSRLLLETESRGLDPRPRPVEIGRRIGLDINPLDPGDPDDRAWLEALLWPEAPERRERLRVALGIAAETDIEMVPGDALATLPEVLDSLPPGEPVVLMDSFTLYQFTVAQLEALDRLVAAARSRRPVHRVSLGVVPDRGDAAALAVDDGSGWKLTGYAQHHGRWLDLYVLP